VTTARPFVLGVAGGTGSGKTTVADRLAEVVGPEGVALLRLDNYYRDRPDLTLDERALINYDHPDAFDWALFLAHVRDLVHGSPVEVPNYDFSLYARAPGTVTLRPTRVVVVEGILVLHDAALRDQFDLKVFVDTDPDVRFIRRLQRDLAERGRSVDNVIEQYLTTVRPMHVTFVEPSKRHADVIIPHGGMNAPALDVLLARLRELV
jgi:uridine kinase